MEEEDRTPTTRRLTVVRVIVACWFMLLGFVTSSVAGLMLFSDGGFPALVMFVVGVALFATGAGLLRKLVWGVWLAAALNGAWWACLVVVQLIALPEAINWVAAIGLAALLAPGLLMWIPAMKAEFADPRRVREGDGLGRAARLVALVVVGGGLVAGVAGEGARVRANFDEYRYQSRCEDSGEAHACAHAALKRLRWAETPEQVRSAANQFRDVCKKERNGLACLWWAHAESAWGLRYTGDAEPIFSRYRSEKLTKLCEDGDVLACWARGRADWRKAYDLEDHRSAIERACSEGDPFGCDLLASFDSRGSERDGSTDAAARACAAGFRRHCPEEATAPIVLCFGGDGAACALAAEAAESPAEKEAILLFADVWDVDMNPGFLGVTPTSDPGFSEACGPTAPVSCLAWGLTMTKEESKSWRPELPPIDELDASFGRSCELGIDAACRAYATRLLDALDPGAERISKANEVLEVACRRGDADGCWMRDFGDSLGRGDLAGLRQSAKESCLRSTDEHHASCMSYANLVAFERDAALSPMDDRVYFEHLHAICRDTGNSGACWRLAYFTMYENATPLRGRRIAYDAATIVCGQREVRGCEALRAVPSKFPQGAPSTPEELAASACEKVGVCLE